MRREVAWLVAVVLLGMLGAAAAAGLDEAAIIGQVSAADHEVEEGYFSLGDGATVIAKPGTELHRWLTAHRGERVRLVVGETKDRLNADPSLRLGSGRDTGQISLRR